MMNIDDLILTKKFSELTASEKEVVLSEMSEEAYNSLQYAIQLKRKEVVVLNPDLKSNLMADFKGKHAVSKSSWWTSLMQFLFPQEKQLFFKPGVQLAFASIVLFLGGTWLFQSEVLTNQNKHTMAKVEPVNTNDNSNEKDVIKSIESEKKLAVSDSNSHLLTQELTDEKPMLKEEKVIDVDKETFLEVSVANAESIEMEDQIFSTNTISAGFAARSLGKDLPEASSSVTVADEPGLLDLLSATY